MDSFAVADLVLSAHDLAAIGKPMSMRERGAASGVVDNCGNNFTAVFD